MKKSIYNVYVVMESQEQCDRMKQLCIDNELPIWYDGIAFIFNYQISGFSEKTIDVFSCENYEFAVWSELHNNRNPDLQVTEQEFIELLKTTK